MTIKQLYPTSRPTLDLNFAQTKRLDPRVTFSRSSSGTYFDNTGLLRSAGTNQARFDHNPATGESLGLLVEEARTNLVTYSEHFDNAAWTKTRVTITPNSAVRLDGTITASKLVRGVEANTNVLYQSVSLPQATYAFSVFAKKGEYNFCTLVLPATQGWDADRWISVNLTDGTYALSASAPTSTSVKAYANGWYRISITHAASGTVTRAGYIDARPSSGYGILAGDGTSGIYIWGAQFETGSFPTSYIPTPATFTSRASTATYYDANGVIQTAGSGVARSNAYFPDSNGVMKPAGLLLEEARTNGDTASATLSGWAASNATFTDQTITTPNGSTTAKLLTEDTSTGNHQISRFYDNIYTGHALSFFVKPNGRTKFRIRLDTTAGGQPVDFDLANMTVTPGATNRSGSIQKFPNGWFRVSAVLIGGYRGYCGFRLLDDSGNESYTGDGTSGVYLWGVQYEKAAPYSSSYIPTAGSQVTRAADVSTSATVTRSADVAQMTGTNFSSWYNQSEGTTLAKTKNLKGLAAPHIVTFTNTASDEIALYGNTLTPYAQAYGNIIAIGQQWNMTKSSTDPSSSAFAYKVNDISFVVSGGSASLDTSALIPSVDRLVFCADNNGTGRTSGHVSRFTYYDRRLTDAQLQALTL